MKVTDIVDTLEALKKENGVEVTRKAVALLYAIMYQESGGVLESYQNPSFSLKRHGYGKGPARGLWHFEIVSVRDLLQHRYEITMKYSRKYVGGTMTETEKGSGIWLPDDSLITAESIWATLQWEPIFACLLARLKLTRIPEHIPEATIENTEAMWVYYVNHWKPGKPNKETWAGIWLKALKNTQYL
ncbi:MAG: hypothetical protein FWG20_05715 [Candidatus Cloacimonetes bacterium]|nr:hypothetical protein [Candidatus Cloacimonadota bacterium]